MSSPAFERWRRRRAWWRRMAELVAGIALGVALCALVSLRW